MNALTLQREIFDAERLAERGKIILDLNEKLLMAQRENESLCKQVTDLKNALAAVTKEATDGTI